MMNKKLTYIILIVIGLLALMVFLILPVFFGAHIDPFSNCGIYDDEGDLHSTCVCYGMRIRVDDFSQCLGLRIDYYE